ncbi:nuclear transport factor 2 family protein [Amycolatopsis sp.]|uniref:nuclear transport factor 2 family protein n=1 Tax=Amycolatopsis sp. TaxID=37632 RepID=UPI002C71E3E3|nr:nuclear transport factor 2 family protein [Amycolatopsis sp.]HVV10324.1 nuclear transport factor 2 family protein [Amycolatopsis sp.]
MEAREFVGDWVRAWNAHDLGALPGHFAEDVVFTSPAGGSRIRASRSSAARWARTRS